MNQVGYTDRPGDQRLVGCQISGHREVSFCPGHGSCTKAFCERRVLQYAQDRVGQPSGIEEGGEEPILSVFDELADRHRVAADHRASHRQRLTK